MFINRSYLNNRVAYVFESACVCVFVNVFVSQLWLRWLSWVFNNIMKLSLLRLLKQETKGSLISTHLQTGVRFSSWSRTLKFIENHPSTGSSVSGSLITIRSTKKVTKVQESVGQIPSRFYLRNMNSHNFNLIVQGIISLYLVE